MQIEPFGVEEWMNAYEDGAVFNLAETCVSSLRIQELLEMAGVNDRLESLLEMRLTYGEIEGSERLREAICGLYEAKSVADVLVTHGAIGANALVYQALIEPEDHVISIVPNYQQHWSIPEALGAHVSQLSLRAEDGYLPDLEALSELCRGGVTLISMSNPNNPTGALMERPFLEELVGIARAHGAYILCDEVYRGTEQSGDRITPSIVDLYEKGIATGSMSKAFSLAGLRLGWMVAPRDVLRNAMVHRDYNTISVGRIDDHLAALALESADRILARSRKICRANLKVLDAWIAREERLSYVKPKAGTTALVKLGFDIPSASFCQSLQQETGVMFLPGSSLGQEGHVRIGYAFEPDLLRDGLGKVSGFLKTL